MSHAIAYKPRYTDSIPYASGEIVKVPKGLAMVKTCRECGERIVCIEAQDFESFTEREYGDHFMRHHNPPLLTVEGFARKRIDDCVSLQRSLPDGFALVLTNADGTAIPQEGEPVHLIVLDAIGYMESEGEEDRATLRQRLADLIAEHTPAEVGAR